MVLKQQLKGSALILTDALEINKQSNNDAVKLLKEVYASEHVLKHNTIKELTELKMLNKKELFEFHSKISQLCDSVKELKLDSNDFLQFYFFNGVSESFRNMYINVTNNTRPNLDQLHEKFFEVTERYWVVKDDTVKYEAPMNRVTSGYAVGVESKLGSNYKRELPKSFTGCSLCKSDGADYNHAMYNCKSYDNPASKLKKISKLNGCVKCGLLNHESKQCRFKFNYKCRCSAWHIFIFV